MEEKERIRVDIRHVNKCDNDEYGTFEIVGSRNILITLSMEKCGTQKEYLLTLLHELLHCWVALLKVNKIIKVSDKNEHKLITLFENYTSRILWRFKWKR